MRHLIVLLISLAFLSSFCQSQKHKNDKYLIKIHNEKYIEAKKFFPEKLLDHFPHELDSNYIVFTDSKSSYGGCILNLELTKKINASEIDSLTNYYDDLASVIYNADDTCLLVVNRFANKDRFFDIKLSEDEYKTINRNCFNSKYPVPNFWNNRFADYKNECNLSEDFVIYVIESEKGKHIDDKHLSSGSFLPDEWKHGFSKGVAISKKNKVIIYWMEVW